MEIILYVLVGIVIGVLIGVLFTRSKSAALTASNSMLNETLGQTRAELESERNKTLQLSSELSGVEKLYERINIEVENLANKILEDKSKRFTDQNKDNLDKILTPLKEKIADFEKKVNEIYVSESKDRTALAEQIKQLHELNKQMTDEANNLTRALKGDSKAQGNWGEFILESVLDKSGLVKGREYFVQESLKNEAGETLRPDVIVKLPEEKSIIIDSKVSLTAYESFSSNDNDETRSRSLNEHIASIRRHLKELSPKEYQSLYGLRSLDFVLMFIPIEPAFAVAVQNDQALFYDAFEKNIIIVSPTTLLATLRTISSIWKTEKQNKNALEIAKKSGELYDKLSAFVDDFLKVGTRMDDAKKSYEEAMKKLSEGRGNIISRAETIKEMGAKSTKAIDQRIVSKSQDGENDEVKILDTN